MSEPTIYILCRFAEKSAIYNTWLEDLPFRCVVVDEYVPDWPLPPDAALVVTHMHYRWEEIHWLRRAYESNQVGILILADGILEYRNTWEHPDLAAGAIFQPVMGHKLACIGRNQARTVESWGNVGKCEVVGLPRFDDMDRLPPQTHDPDHPFRLLIATANTPAFNAQQRETVIESLTHIKERMAANTRVNGRPTEVIWRVTDGLHKDLDLPAVENEDELSKVIDQVDAVITTPSTLYLESIYRGRPTAILDFHNSPQYTNSAWFINAPKHFNWILRELENPPQPKLLFQNSVLDDVLECRTPAKPRMLKLIREMVEIAVSAKNSGKPLEFPHRMVDDPDKGFARVSAEFDLAKLYPEQKTFANQDRDRLQVELNQAIHRLESAPTEIQERVQYFSWAVKRLDESRQKTTRALAKAAELHSRLRAIRKRFGIEPNPQSAEKAPAKEAPPSDQTPQVENTSQTRSADTIEPTTQ